MTTLRTSVRESLQMHLVCNGNHSVVKSVCSIQLPLRPMKSKSIYAMVPLLVQNKNKTCSVDTASWALDGPLWHSHDVRNNGIPRNCSNASLITKGDQELTWQYPLSKFHSKQARVLLCKSILHFTMGFYGSPCDYTQNHCLSILYVTKLVTLWLKQPTCFCSAIRLHHHIELIAIPCASLITSRI